MSTTSLIAEAEARFDAAALDLWMIARGELRPAGDQLTLTRVRSYGRTIILPGDHDEVLAYLVDRGFTVRLIRHPHYGTHTEYRIEVE